MGVFYVGNVFTQYISNVDGIKHGGVFFLGYQSLAVGSNTT